MVVTREGAAMGGDRMNTIVPPEGPWVNKATQKPPTINPQKEKEIFLEERREFAGNGASISGTAHDQSSIFDMTPVLHPTRSSIEEVSSLKSFLQSFMNLIRYQNALEE